MLLRHRHSLGFQERVQFGLMLGIVALRVSVVLLRNRHPPDLLRIAIRGAERHIDPAAL